jgi:hypothetical protein
MSVQSFLFHYGQYVAYAVTWMIHAIYLGTIVRRFRLLRRDFRDVGKGN